MWKHLLLFLIGIILSVGADAQNYSDNVTLVSIDGDVVTLNSTASAQKKKEAEEQALRSAFNALFHSGIDGLKSGVSLISGETKDYDYRFFQENRYLNYLTTRPKTEKTEKIRGNTIAHVRISVNLKTLKSELERNKLTLNPGWSDAKVVNATASLNPTIVVVPDVNATTGYSFESMRAIAESSDMVRYTIDRVAEEFQKRGYKTRDFISQLQNSKNSSMLRDGAQTDNATMFVQQLPGDIVVTVDVDMITDASGKSEVTLNLRAVEKQTAGRLATKAFASGYYHTRDSMRLSDYAVKKITADFFSQLSSSFEDMIKKGREVNMELNLSEAVSDWDFDSDSPASGEFFKDALDEWLRANAYQSNYDMSQSTDKYISIRINVPLWDAEKNRSYTLSNFGGDFRKFLRTQLGDEYKPKVTSMGQKILVIVE